MPKIFRPWEDNSVKVSPNNWPFKPEARLCATDCSPKITSEKNLVEQFGGKFSKQLGFDGTESPEPTTL